MRIVDALPFLLMLGVWSCGSSSAPARATDGGFEVSAAGLAIVTATGEPVSANAGDAVPLKVVLRMADGTTAPLPADAKVTWSSPKTVTALAPTSSAASPIPTPGKEPTAFFIDNPGRPDRNADLVGVLFALDQGQDPGGRVSVTANVSGIANGGSVETSVVVGPLPKGDATRGRSAYGASGANCAACHGPTGHGTPGEADGGTDAAPEYKISGHLYPYPAPGLNAEPGNAGSDPAWNASLFSMAARADMDNGGLTLRVPMPDWLSETESNGARVTTQDFFDIYAFMQTQSH